MMPSVNDRDVTGTSPALDLLVEEFTVRLQAGEPVSVEEFAAAHPEHAERLRLLLPAVQVLAELGRSAASAGGSLPPVACPGEAEPQTLGDFQIVREVGRGGMGVVYEAEQLSLGRRVALKILPFGATMDPRQLQRFQNEARAAASLEHPHIVPVYGVGCERGIHYYSMKFINGQSLAALLEARRQPLEPRGPAEPPPTGNGSANTVSAGQVRTERDSAGAVAFGEIARWGIEAAEALDYAHSVGIVHRDIKPANLLSDSHGNLWVTDFGLARTAADQGLTMSGDVLGTVRYMSPEQSLGQRGVVDHRTDIYALGVTLYELLTLRPAFAGTDRQTLLRQIAINEPQLLRRINPAIPGELETIVLKAIEKSPADRYASAQALAADLRRYLRHEPIRARRASLLQRARKVARRHPGVTVTAALATVIGLLLGVAGLAANNWLVRQEQLRTEAALTQAEQEKAVAQAVRSFLRDKLLAQADPHVQADALLKGGGKASAAGPNVTIRELLDRAAQELTEDQIEGQFPGQPLVQAEILKTIGEAYRGIGVYPPALAHLERARGLYVRELGTRHADTLATIDCLAMAKLDAGQWNEAARLLEQVRDWRVESFGPHHPDTLETLNNLVRSYFRLGQHDEALRLGKEIVSLRAASLGADHPQTLASMNNLANNYAALKRFEDALGLHQEIWKLRQAKLRPDHPETLKSMNNVANCYDALGRHRDSLGLHEQTLEGRRRTLGPIHPETLKSMYNVAVAHVALGHYYEAVQRHEKTLELRTAQLPPKHPDTLKSLNALAWILATAPDPKVRDPGRALQLAKQATAGAPDNGGYLNTLGIASYRAGDWEATVKTLTRSMNLRKSGDASDFLFLAMAHWRLEDRNEARTWYARAVQWIGQNHSDEGVHRFRAEAAELLQMEKK
jgi:serine/threonine protein kinase/tetratricopeptide (TPR) repeat protein